MSSAAVQVEGKEELPFLEAELLQLRRSHSRLRFGFVAVLGLLCLCIAGQIWLANDAVNDDDDSENLKSEAATVRLTSEASAGTGQSIFAGSGYWTTKEPLPFPRSDHQVIAVDDFIYIIGGLDNNGTALEDVTVYDTVLGTYSAGPSLPVPLHRFAAAYDNSRRTIYVLGGLSDPNARARNSLLILDVEREEWADGPELLTPRSDLCGAFLDDRIYAIGGYSRNFAATLDTVEAFTVSSGEWETVRSLPTPRGDCRAAQLGDQLIVIGGYYDVTGRWNADSFRGEVEVYSPATDMWEERAQITNARGDKSVSVISNDRILVVGGETHNRGVHTMVAAHHVEEYVMSEDVWIDRAPLPQATFRAASAYVDGLVFVFGGHRTCEAPDSEPASEICIATDVLQVYFDFSHPNIFII